MGGVDWYLPLIWGRVKGLFFLFLYMNVFLYDGNG